MFEKGDSSNRQKLNGCSFQQVLQQNSEAVVQRCSVKKVLLKISQNLQENACARVAFLIKFSRLWHRCFLVNFAKVFKSTFFYRTPSVVAFENWSWLRAQHRKICFLEVSF